MFNRSYQRRRVKAAGGGHQVAADAAASSGLALRLPWAGIFEASFAKAWRPLVLTAAVAESLAIPKVAVRPKSAATRCKKGSGRLQGVQLELFAVSEYHNKVIIPDPRRNSRQSPANQNQFPPLAPIEDIDEDRPLFDLFPDAYV